MTKGEQISAVAHAADLTVAQARAALDAVAGVVCAGLLEEGHVQLSGVGNFVVRQRRPRNVINPATGVPMHLPASAAISFKPTLDLRESVRERWS